MQLVTHFVSGPGTGKTAACEIEAGVHGAGAHYLDSSVLDVGSSRNLDFTIASLENKAIVIFDENDNIVVSTEYYKRLLSRFPGIQ